MEPEVKHRVNFYVEDANKMGFPENFYDVVYRYGDILRIVLRLKIKICFYSRAVVTPLCTSQTRRGKSCTKTF